MNVKGLRVVRKPEKQDTHIPFTISYVGFQPHQTTVTESVTSVC